MKEINLQKQLVEQCIGGNTQAQKQLYNQYSRAMYSICLRMCSDQMDAEDVMQDAFVDVFRGLRSYAGKATLGAWIKRIVVNKNIDFLKKKRLFFEQIDDTIVPPSVQTNVIQMEKYDVEKIKRYISLLPDGYRVVLSLYLLEGYDHQEIGEILNISSGTSKSQYARAKKKLKELLNHDAMRQEII